MKKIQRFKQNVRELEILLQIKLQKIRDDSSGKLEYLQFLSADMIVDLERKIKFFEKTLKEIRQKQEKEEVQQPITIASLYEKIEKKIRKSNKLVK